MYSLKVILFKFFNIYIYKNFKLVNFSNMSGMGPVNTLLANSLFNYQIYYFIIY